MLKISVVTPTLNQAAYIEETIQSVLDQECPNFEHIVIDGGSTDGTVEIIKKHSHLKWISEKDQGRADALNKGFSMASGDIIAWINSDDYYFPETFDKVADFFQKNPDSQVLVGRAKVVDEAGDFLFDQALYPESALNFEGLLLFWKNGTLPQPSLFFRREALETVGLFDVKLHDYPDYDLVLRLSRQFKIDSTLDFLSCIRIQQDAGSVIDIKNGVLEKKLLTVSKPYWKNLPVLGRFNIWMSYIIYYPRIRWEATYESFAMKHKSQLKSSWEERQSFFEFISTNKYLFKKHPVESFFAGIHFLVFCLKKLNEN